LLPGGSAFEAGINENSEYASRVSERFTNDYGNSPSMQYMSEDLPASGYSERSVTKKYLLGTLVVVILCAGAFFIYKPLAKKDGPNDVQVLDASFADTSRSSSDLVTANESSTTNFYNEFDSSSTIDDKQEPKQMEAQPDANAAAPSEFDPKAAIFSFIGDQTWLGKMTYASDGSSHAFRLTADGNNFSLKPEAFYCPSYLTFKSYNPLQDDIISFTFNEYLVDETADCSAGHVTITATPSLANSIYVEFFDGAFKKIADGYFYRQ
jgi:hypothetical protein